MRSAPSPLTAIAASLLPLLSVSLTLAQDELPPIPAAEPPALNAADTPAPEDEKAPEKIKPTEAQIRAAIAALGSDDFKQREKATKELWEMGRDAEQLLKEAVESDRGELSYRGGRILEEFELGLYPDTPAEFRRLIEQYRNGDSRTRFSAIRELAAMGHTSILSNLLRRERDPNARNQIAQIFADNAEQLAPALLAKGDYDKADQLLQLASVTRKGMVNYAAFLAGTGRLEAAVEKQRGRADDSEQDRLLLAWMLRIDGRFKEAAEQFEQAGQATYARSTLAASGDPLAFATACIDKSKTTIADLGYQLAVARLSGDTEAAAALTADIETYPQTMPNEATHCVNVLLLNGAPELAFSIARKHSPTDFVALSLARYEFDPAFEAFGIDAAKAPYDKWLAKFSKEFVVEEEDDIPDAIKPAIELADLCIDTGQKEEAIRILSATANLLAESNESLLEIVRAAGLLRLREFAIETAVRAIELETEIATIGALYYTQIDSTDRLRNVIWEHLRETKPDQSLAAALRELGVLLGYPGLGDSEPAPLVAARRKAADAAPAAEKGVMLLLAAELAGLHDLHEDAIGAYRAALAHIGEDARLTHHFSYAVALFDAERYKDAATQFHLSSMLDETKPIPVYFEGLARHRAGEVEEGSRLRERSALMSLGNTYILSYLAENAYENQDYDFAMTASRLVARLVRPDAATQREQFRLANTTIANIHTARREFAPAAKAAEIAMLALIASDLPSALGPFSIYGELGRKKARAAFAAGLPDRATAITAEFLKTNPSDSSMLEDTFQLLADQGKTAEALALFDTVYPRSLAAAERFPGRGQHHNNLAWLLSRCGQKLDQALEHAERAVELEPQNGAFLDTLAEVYFQRGDRVKAIASSEKAIIHFGNDPQLLYQLERFTTGKPEDR